MRRASCRQVVDRRKERLTVKGMMLKRGRRTRKRKTRSTNDGRGRDRGGKERREGERGGSSKRKKIVGREGDE